jgi:competence protein ComEA
MRLPHLSQRTATGAFFWLLFMILLALIPQIYLWVFPPPSIRIHKSIRAKMDHYAIEKKRTRTSYFQKKNRYKAPPHRFNPNEYTAAEWMALGLSVKQANAVISFCKRPLKSNEDLKKIFVIPEVLYELIKDSTYYPQLPTKQSYVHEASKVVKPPKAVVILSVGSLDSASLVNLPGIGPFFAHHVMKYEKSLGGFYCKEQLWEIFKMNEEVFGILCKHIDFSKPRIRKISLNAADFNSLSRHPYIDKWQANSILKIRKQIGGYQTVKEILKSHLIRQEDFVKLEPYVSL